MKPVKAVPDKDDKMSMCQMDAADFWQMGLDIWCKQAEKDLAERSSAHLRELQSDRRRKSKTVKRYILLLVTTIAVCTAYFTKAAVDKSDAELAALAGICYAALTAAYMSVDMYLTSYLAIKDAEQQQQQQQVP